MTSARWRREWDVVFSVVSLLIAFGIGVVFGNIIEGIPLNANRDSVGNSLGFIRPYSVLVGVMTVVLFMAWIDLFSDKNRRCFSRPFTRMGQ